jgi:hypothetical protein
MANETHNYITNGDLCFRDLSGEAFFKIEGGGSYEGQWATKLKLTESREHNAVLVSGERCFLKATARVSQV